MSELAQTKPEKKGTVTSKQVKKKRKTGNHHEQEKK
jgi:hypothetical protein